MIRVVVGERESIDSAIMRFKKKCEKAGVLRDFKRSSYFVKPSQKRRMRRLKAIRRALRIQARMAS
ncbi:MAG: 30S ribosomal protein S21 [candidate division KSB1 bacterium]|nr:30S ribosomal protein S21 [candidate division KSB1 bacterium]